MTSTISKESLLIRDGIELSNAISRSPTDIPVNLYVKELLNLILTCT